MFANTGKGTEPAEAEMPDDGQQLEGEERERALELAKEVYDEMRMFVEIPQGLVNQVYRHGLIPRKAGKDGYTRMKGSCRYHKECVDRRPIGYSGLIQA